MPELTHLTPERIKVLKQGLIDGKLILPYRYLRGFLVAGCKALNKSGNQDGTNAVSIAQEALTDVELIIGPLQATPAVVTELEGAYVAAYNTKLKEMRDAGQKFDVGVKHLAGDAIEPKYSDIIEKLSDSTGHDDDLEGEYDNGYQELRLRTLAYDQLDSDLAIRLSLRGYLASQMSTNMDKFSLPRHILARTDVVYVRDPR